ncbi:hypothetical protein TA3x_000469 [Tundrisphaera sp. TA3]|uniref:hypothetical protein n=1 Tax=Tundrisphaera sp. TA3 TaxID=3435775 RepID=UPI003EB85DC1
MTPEIDKIRALVENGELNNRLYLVKNNVDFDVAFSLEDHQVTAWAIIFGRMDGGEWDWASMSWKTDR